MNLPGSTSMIYLALKPFSCPKVGSVKRPGVQLQPVDEMSPAPGERVDLGHLSKDAIAFLTAEGCISPVEADKPSTKKGEK